MVDRLPQLIQLADGGMWNVTSVVAQRQVACCRNETFEWTGDVAGKCEPYQQEREHDAKRADHKHAIALI
jgi:hypothetical protein